jgi:hypothetical protein
MAAMSGTLYFGLPIDSMYNAFVFESIAASKSFGSSVKTNLTPMPNFFNKTIHLHDRTLTTSARKICSPLNWLNVPP